MTNNLWRKEDQNKQKKALVAYLVAGDLPDELTVEMLVTWEKNGVSVVELGVPFSEPVADGVVIANAHNRSLQHAKDARYSCYLNDILTRLLPKIRAKTNIPIVLMSYINPIMSYGESFLKNAKHAGVDGFLVVDMPVEEAVHWAHEASLLGLAWVGLCALTTGSKRLEAIVKASTGFIYCVSVKGVTGAHSKFDDEALQQCIEDIKRSTTLPVLVGFGVQNGLDAKRLSLNAHGVIVGTAFVRLIDAWHKNNDKIKLLNDTAHLTQSIGEGLL